MTELSAAQPLDDALGALVAAVAGLPYLGMRLRFVSMDDGSPVHLHEQVWRGALKQAMPAAVRQRLMPEPRAGKSPGSPPPPGLTLHHDAQGVVLGFFGHAAKDAVAVLDALVAAAAGLLPQRDGRLIGLGQRQVRAVLEGLDWQRGPMHWLPGGLPGPGQDPTAAQHALARWLPGNGPSHGVRAAADSAAKVQEDDPLLALVFESPCALGDGHEPPALGTLMRSLWPRMHATVASWHHGDALPPRSMLPAAVETLSACRAMPGSNWLTMPQALRSGRQQARWSLPAHRGVLLYADVSAPVSALLHLGQVFGVGQGATLGLGRYAVLRRTCLV
jgi:hypothetical protein